MKGFNKILAVSLVLFSALIASTAKAQKTQNNLLTSKYTVASDIQDEFSKVVAKDDNLRKALAGEKMKHLIDIEYRFVDIDRDSYNPYLGRLMEEASILRWKIEEKDHYSRQEMEKEGLRPSKASIKFLYTYELVPDYPKMLKELDHDVMFQIKEKGIETENPVDDFIEFLKTSGLAGKDGKTKNVSPLYFLVVVAKEKRMGLKVNKFGVMKKIVQYGKNGKIYKMGSEEKDFDNFLVRIDGDPQPFLEALHYSSTFSKSQAEVRGVYELKHGKGEGVFLVR